MRTPEILDAIKRTQGVESDYAVAKLLGVTRSAVSKYRLGGSHLDDATAIKAAALAGLNPGFVIACAHRERAKTAEEKAVWTSMLERLGGLAAALLLAPALFMAGDARAEVSPGSAYASQIQESVIFRIF
ncbi:MAG: hypothetical protein JNL99_01900 [Zoogloea sp.]|nr:hypothetical protein [Zoogloea sp.]